MKTLPMILEIPLEDLPKFPKVGDTYVSNFMGYAVTYKVVATSYEGTHDDFAYEYDSQIVGVKPR